MDTWRHDLTFAVRTLRKGPGFTAIATITVALGIGACTAVFSVVNGVLLRPLPYGDPGRLVLMWCELRTRNMPDFPLPIPDLGDVRDRSTTFEGLAGLFAPGRTAVSGDAGEPEQVRTAFATPNVFHVLGVRTILGRDFVDEDGLPDPTQPPDAFPGGAASRPQLPNIAILSHRFWQRRYGGNPAIVNTTIGFGNGRAQIVGVLPPDFELLFPPRTGIESDVDMWIAARLNFETAGRDTGALRTIGRLKSGTGLAQAQADLDGIAATLREQYPTKKNVDMHFRVVDMHADLVRDVRPLVWSLFGAVAFVLLIACANVANLLLVRASSRQRELVIRSAIGGSRWRLVRQMLMETLVLALLGGALAVAFAYAGVGLLASMAPPRLPRLGAIQIDGAVLAFSTLITLLTTALCGVVPALRASRQNVADLVRASVPGLRPGRTLRYGVVIAEVALSFVLLAGSGLMIRSFLTLQRVDSGYDPENVLTFFRPTAQPTPEGRAAFMRQVGERLRAIPGVLDAAAVTPLPLDGGVAALPWATEEAGRVDASAFRQANFAFVTPSYFETMRTRVIAGRTFTEADNTRDQAPKVVVDELIAAQAYPNESAIGRTLLIRSLRGGPDGPLYDRVEIVGVVAHQRRETLTSVGREALFLTDAYGGFGAQRWVVRTAGDPAAMASVVAAAVAEIDATMPIAEVQPMRAFVDKANGPTRFAATTIGVFAGVAVLLAGVGLFGVLSTSVRQRSAEIGMRMVCGARPGGILRLILAEGLKLSIAGMVLGFVAALGLTGLIRTMLVSVTPTDPLTFAAITILFLAVAIVATLVPARRAAQVDPVVAIRDLSV